MLSEQRKKQLDEIVGKMVENKETDDNVQFVVDDFKEKYGSEVVKTEVKEKNVNILTAPYKALAESSVGGLKGLGSSVVGLGQLVLKGASKLPLPSGAKTAIQQGIQAGEELKQTVLKPKTTFETIGKTVEQVGEFIIPVGGEVRAFNLLKGIIPKAGKIAQLGAKALGSGGEFAAKTAIQTGGDKKQTAISAGLGAISPVIGAGVNAAKNIVAESIPERLYSIIFKTAKDDLRQAYRSISKGEELNPTLAKEVLDRGLKGNSQNMSVYAFQKLDQIENQVQNAVKGMGNNIKQTIIIENKKGYLNILQTIDEQFGKTFNTGRTKTAQGLARELNATKGNEISTDLALRLRRFIDKMRNTSSFRLDTNLAAAQEGFKDATNLLRKKLAEAGLGGPMNEERIWINAVDDIISDAAKRKNKNALGLFDLIAGGGGMAAGGPLGGISSALAVRWFQQPSTLTNLAQALYKMKNIPSLRGLFKTIPPLTNQENK